MPVSAPRTTFVVVLLRDSRRKKNEVMKSVVVMVTMKGSFTNIGFDCDGCIHSLLIAGDKSTKRKETCILFENFFVFAFGIVRRLLGLGSSPGLGAVQIWFWLTLQGQISMIYCSSGEYDDRCDKC